MLAKHPINNAVIGPTDSTVHIQTIQT